MRYFDWYKFKADTSTAKGIYFQSTEDDYSYHIKAIDGLVVHDIVMLKATHHDGPSIGLSDWETNFLPLSNKKVSILRTPFSANTVEFKGDSIVAQTCAIDSVTALVLVPSATEYRLLNGGIFYSENAIHGDSISAKVLDPNELVVKIWIVRWGVIPGSPMDLITPQAGEIPPTYKLCIDYTAVGGGSPRKVTINYRLNKRL